MDFQILIIDDDKYFSDELKEILQSDDREISIAFNGREALKILSENEIHLVLLDENLPDISGLSVLEKITTDYKNIISIMITASNSIPLAVKAIQMGAYHYVVKPFKSEELKNIVKIALEKVSLERKLKDLESGIISLEKPVFIGASESVNEIRNKIETLKEYPFSSILITGETGTGKSIVAKYIHWQCFKDMSKFIHISCADIQPNLLESELFGHTKGAFTDAKATKKGLFELANKGTLFLDEIDSTPVELQRKLLYFLDNKKIRPIGATKEINTDVRLITATNANLTGLVEEQKFRKDLYYRLNMINMHIKPLKERKEDIKILTHYFIELFNRTFSKSIYKITDEAIAKLEKYSWPGNTRELRNTIERAMIFCKNNVIDLKDISLKTDEKAETDISLDNMQISDKIGISESLNKDEILSLKQLELIYIKKVLKLMDGNKSKTARALDITLPTLLSKLKE